MKPNRDEKEAMTAGMWAAYAEYQKKSAVCGLKFSLTFLQFQQTVNKSCFFCRTKGKTLYTTHHKRSILGRLDRSLGYTETNSIPICHRCDSIKRYVHPKYLKRTAAIVRKLIQYFGPGE
jgi:hypothetical protein